MTRHTCTDCNHPIRNGEAVVRSVAFAQVAYHRECWAARDEVKVRAA